MKIKFFATLLLVFSFLVPTAGGRIKCDDYKDVRIKKFPLAVQCWSFRKFSFFETLDKVNELGIKYLEAYPGQVLSKDMPDVKFNENLSDELIRLVKKKLREHNIKLVNYGVVGFKNTEESMRKVFDFARKLGIRTIVTEPQFEDFDLLERMVRKYNIKIAIHNHPEPSKYAHPETVLEHVKGRDLRIGACGDTGHWMRSKVKPLDAIKLLKGRLISFHLKDLNVFGDKENAYDVPYGKGAANIRDILAELTKQNFHGFLSIEYENQKEVENPVPSIKKGIEYIKSITYYQDYEEILKWNEYEGYTKAGWNHYGPGYFELDRKTGVLKSHGGMGLLWYSRKKYKNFILELDYKVDRVTSNSGIFLRVPDVPTSDDYIHHCLEVQVYDCGKGIHKTGALYDGEPPKVNAFKEPGEWNHIKITVIGNHYRVELNGVLVNDWDAEPRGKVKDLPDEGYVGVQNHDWSSSVYYRNIFIKELK